MTVIYKPVPDYPGYEVGDDGTVWSNHRPKCIYEMRGDYYELLPVKKANGYWQVSLVRNRVKASFQIHQLVLLCHVGECPLGCVVAHNDSNTANNRLDNLRYTTQKDNLDDRAYNFNNTRRYKFTH